MAKLLFLFLILFSFKSIESKADSEDCSTAPAIPQELMDSISATQLRNCYKEDIFFEAAELEPIQSELCTVCKNSFERDNSTYLKEKKRSNYIKLIFSEFKKSFSENLKDLSQLRYLSRSSNSTNSLGCNIDSYRSKFATCQENLKKGGISEKDIYSFVNDSIAGDFNGAKVCSESSALLRAKRSIAIEQLLTPEFIQKLLTTGSELTATENIYLDELRNNHPTFKTLYKNKSAFDSFLRSIQTQQGVTFQDKLKSALSSENVNQTVNTEISNRCNRSFNDLISKVCEVNLDEVEPGPPENYRKLFDSPKWADTPLELVDESNFENNINLISFCSTKSSSSNSVSNEWLPEKYKNLSFSSYLYERDRDILSTQDSNKCDAPENCPTDTSLASVTESDLIQCKVLELSTRKPELFSLNVNPKFDDLFRSLVTNNISNGSTKITLQREGFLPQDDGSFLTPPSPSQTNTPQLATANSSGSATGTRSNSVTPTSSSQFAQSQTQASQRNTQNRSASALPYNPITSPAFGEDFEERLSQLSSDLTNQEKARLENFQREMARRLSSNSTPPSRSQVEQVAREVARQRVSTSPLRQSQIAQSYADTFDQYQNSPSQAPGFANAGGVNLGNDLAGPSRSYVNEQNAKMAMAKRSGPSGSSGSIASGGSAALAASTTGRSPASVTDSENTSLNVRITLDELQANPQEALAQLPSNLPETFFLEIQGATDVYRYQVKKSGSRFQISQVLGGNSGRAFISRLESLLRERAPIRSAQLTNLQDTVTGSN